MKKLLSALLFVTMFATLTACAQTKVDTNSSSGSTSETVADTSNSGGSTSEAATDANNSSGSESETSVWPTTDQVELVVPYKAGGDTDLYCRAIADALSKKLGVTFVVSNVTGAGAMNAAVDVLEGPADGSKFLFGHNSYLAATAAGTATVDVTTEMKPAGTIVADSSLCIYATKATGFTSMQDVTDACKAGKEVRISTVANTYPNYCIRRMIDAAGVDIRCIETGSTVGEQAIAAMDGQAELVQGQYVAMKDYVENHDFNVIGVFADKVPVGMENFKTFASQGIDVAEPKYYCFWANPDTDDAVVNAFSAALKDVQNDEELKKLLNSYYAEVNYMTPEEMQTMENNTVDEMKKYFAANQSK